MAKGKKKQQTEVLKARLNWAEKTLHAMLHGEKPAIDPENKDQAWLFEQMSRMYRAGFLCEEPKCYLTMPGEDLDAIIDPEHGTTLRQLKGITSLEPLPKILTSEAKSFRLRAEEHGLNNYKIFGLDEAYRYHQDPLDQRNDADAFVLTHGGLMELYQYICSLNASINSSSKAKDNPLHIIHNSDSYWNPFIKEFKKLIRKNGHIVTNTRRNSVDTLMEKLGDKYSHQPKMGDIPKIAHKGAHIYVVTGTGKKVTEYRDVFKRRGTDVRIKWFHEAFEKPEAAEEFSYSYTGNLIEKFHNLYEHIRDNIGVAEFRKQMIAKGSDVDIALAMLDDSGFETSSGLTTGPEFSHAAYRLNSYRDFGPGPELKNIMSAMQNQTYEGTRGTRAMIKRMFAAAERIKQERIDAGEENPEISMNVRDRVTNMIFSFKDMLEAIEEGKSWEQAFEDMPIRCYQATTDGTLIDEPRPDVKAVDTKYFLIPTQDGQRTQAQIERFVPLHSYTAQVVKAISRSSEFYKIENPDSSLSRRFTKESGEAWLLGTQHSLHKNRKSTGLKKGVSGKLKGLYKFMAGNGGMHDLSIEREHKIKDEDGNISVMKTPLNNFETFTRKAEGFFLTPDSKHLQGDEYFWERVFAFFSLIVGKQIKDKSVSAKPFFVSNCPTWKPLLEVFNHYAAGLIPEMPEHIFNGILKTDDPQLVDKLNDAFADYEADEVPQHFFQENGRQCKEDQFEVTIYCSASTTDGDMKVNVREFACDLSAYGFAIKNGGGSGSDGLMVETSNGARIFNEQLRPFLKTLVKDKSTVPTGRVSSIQCQYTKEEEGLMENVDYWAIYPTIYQRMHALQKCDAELVLPGGAGTIQEIVASIIMRKNGLTPIENRPLIIVNEDDAYTPFLDIVPKDDLELYNIQVVGSREEAMEELIKARKAAGKEPQLPYTKEEYENYKKAFQLDPGSKGGKQTPNSPGPS